jgi:hypothetical protein
MEGDFTAMLIWAWICQCECISEDCNTRDKFVSKIVSIMISEYSEPSSLSLLTAAAQWNPFVDLHGSLPNTTLPSPRALKPVGISPKVHHRLLNLRFSIHNKRSISNDFLI